jgi:hypothetical protein
LIDRHGHGDKLRQLLLERAQQQALDPAPSPAEREIQVRAAAVNDLQEQLIIVRRRMALEKDDDRYAAIAAEFDCIRGELQSAEQELAAKQRSNAQPVPRSPEAEVNAAMALLDDIGRITSDESARADINPLLRKRGVWIGLNFGSAIKGKKRVVRRLLSGVRTFGDRELPVPLFGRSNRQGPENCDHQTPRDPDDQEPWPEPAVQTTASEEGQSKKATAGASARTPATCPSERTASPGLGQPDPVSFTKGSRGDWIRTSELLNPIQEVLARKIARAGRFSTYESHTSHIIHVEPHIFHRTRRVSYHFLPAEFGPVARLNPVGARLMQFQVSCPACPPAVPYFGRCDRSRWAELRCARRWAEPKRAHPRDDPRECGPHGMVIGLPTQSSPRRPRPRDPGRVGVRQGEQQAAGSGS